MQSHCPSRKRRKRSLRSTQTCEEKSCICSDWGMAEMTPKSPAVRQASITTGTLLMGVLCWTNVSMGLEHRSIGGGKLRCVISLCSCEKTPVRRPPRLASGTSVHEENEFVRESLRFVAATNRAGRTHRAERAMAGKRASIQNAYSRTNGAVTFRKKSRTEEGAGYPCALAWLGFALLP